MQLHDFSIAQFGLELFMVAWLLEKSFQVCNKNVSRMGQVFIPRVANVRSKHDEPSLLRAQLPMIGATAYSHTIFKIMSITVWMDPLHQNNMRNVCHTNTFSQPAW